MNEEQQKVWDALKAPPQRTLQEQLRESHRIGKPTTQLKNSFVDIATKYLNRPQFVHFLYKDDMINEAIMQMLKYWNKIDPDQHSNNAVFAYFVQIASNAAFRVLNREKEQQKIKIYLAESINTDTTEF